MTCSFPDLRLHPRAISRVRTGWDVLGRTLLAGVMSVLLLPLSPMLGIAQSLPADGATATARLEASPRHGEWITHDAGGGDRVQAWVAYPERSDPAPVVVVIHDIRAMSDWARAVGDQLAADGFIAVVPDLLSGRGPGTSPPTEALSSIRAPVLGLYGGADNRVNSTVPAAQAELERLGKRYEVNIYEGAGHGFLGRQSGQEGANQAASEGAWPATISFFRELLGE